MTGTFLDCWRWFISFTPSERVALCSAFLVLIGVAGEEIAELEIFKEEEGARAKKSIKRFAMWFLLVGLVGDGVGIVMGQSEMTALTKEAGDAKRSATIANGEATKAKKAADAADAKAEEAKSKAD